MRILSQRGISTYSKLYKTFCRNCNSAPQDLFGAKKEFANLERIFIPNNRAQELTSRTENFIEHLSERGNNKLADILTNELGKLHLRIGNYPEAEKFTIQSIKNNYAEQDLIHAAARFSDLEIIYKNLGDQKGIYQALHDKKSCIKEILSDYDFYKQKFQSIVRPPTTKESLQVQLAYTYTELSKLLLFNKPKDSCKALVKAKEIYDELGKTKEINYYKNRIRWVMSKIRLNEYKARYQNTPPILKAY